MKLKRWLCGLLAGIMLPAVCGLAEEETEGPSDADLQETVVTREGETLGTLPENLIFLKDLLQNEEVRSLLKIQDVKEIATEVVWKALVWMYHNRPVTMKILAEFGFSETDCRCVEKLWDSAERLSDAGKAYNESEDGLQLLAELEAVRDDPELRKTMEKFSELMSDEDLNRLMDELSGAIKAENAEAEAADGRLTELAAENQINTSSFTGYLIVQILHIVESSEWAKDSIPDLLTNENLWRLLIHLSKDSQELDAAVKEECRMIADDPEMVDFLKRTTQQLNLLNNALKIIAAEEAEQQKANDEVNGEDAP